MPDYEREVEKQRRWNFAVNVADLSFFNLALALLFPSTVLPLYASHLTHSAVFIGLIAAIWDVSAYLPQLLVARHSETLARFKPFVVRVSVVERLPYLVLALGVLLWPACPAWLAYLVLALGVAAARTAGGMASPAWRGMLAKVIALDRRGRVLGTGYAIGGALGIGGALAVRAILARVPYPTAFGLIFGLAFCAHVLSWISLALNREPAREPKSLPPPFSQYLRELPGLLRGMPSFSRFLASQVLVILGGLGTSFYVIYGRRVLGISDAGAAALTIAALGGQAVGSLALGRIGDRLGNKRMNGLAATLAAAAVAIMAVGPGIAGLAVAFVLMNLGQVGMRISQSSISMEIAGPQRAPTFSAVMSTLLAAPSLLAPLAGGWVVDSLGFGATFVVGLAFTLGGLIVLAVGVEDPRVASARASGRSSLP